MKLSEKLRKVISKKMLRNIKERERTGCTRALSYAEWKLIPSDVRRVLWKAMGGKKRNSQPLEG